MRRPIALTDAELAALVFVSNVALDDEEMFSTSREKASHARANAKLRTESRRRGRRFDGDPK